MDTYKLTTKSQEAVAEAVRRAGVEGHPHVEPVHVLLALMGQTDSTAAPLLEAVGVDLAALRADAEQVAGRLPRATGATVSSPGMDRPSMQVITAAAKRAADLGDEYISTEHLLVGLADEGGEIASIMRRRGATADALLAAFEAVRGRARVCRGRRAPERTRCRTPRDPSGRRLRCLRRRGRPGPRSRTAARWPPARPASTW